MKHPYEYPDEWIENLLYIRMKIEEMETTISDETVMAHILEKLPNNYETLVTTMHINLGNLTFDSMRDQITSFYTGLAQNQTVQSQLSSVEFSDDGCPFCRLARQGRTPLRRYGNLWVL